MRGEDETRFRRLLAIVFAVTLATNLIGIGWGLPNGNQTWAADSVAPMTPLSVAYHVFLGEGPNSGYFYFKYPFGHQLLLAALQAPVIAFAALSGDLSGIETDYPYGFSSPETYLTAMAITARLVSAVFGAGLIVLVGLIGRRLAGITAGLLASLLALGSYPICFYSHTSNVEISFLFWAFLGLYATLRAMEPAASPRWYWLLGIAAAMGVSTKEQISGFFASIPLLILLVNYLERSGKSDFRPIPRGAVTGAIACAIALVVVNGAFYNPAGYLNRWRFLTHTLPTEIREKYSAYEFPIDFSTSWGFFDELTHIGKAVSAVGTSIGWPACVLGLIGLIVMVAQHRHRALWIIGPLISYYVISLRALKQVEIRYTMPLSTLLVIPAAVVLAGLWNRSDRESRSGLAARGAVVAVVAFGLVYAGEVLFMLRYDARYAAERWAATRIADGQTVEVYQRWTYLPRWQYTEGVSKVAFDDITVEGIERRRPDLIVLSSKALEGMTMYPNPDWRDGRGMMLEDEENREFLDALLDGSLGYRATAEFRRTRLIPRELITSLDPAITVYERGKTSALER